MGHYRYGDLEIRTSESPHRMYEFFGIGKDSGEPFSWSRSEINRAWNGFVALSRSHGGIKPGSLRSRDVPRWFHKCYARVQSWSPDMTTLYSQHVECVAESKVQATVGAKNAAILLKHYLENPQGPNHKQVVIKRGIRCKRYLNTLKNSCTESASCTFECTTLTGGKSIIVSRYDDSREEACSAAEEAAIHLGDDFDGISNCAPLPADSSLMKELLQGCTNCGPGESAEAASKEGAVPIPTPDSASDEKSNE